MLDYERLDAYQCALQFAALSFWRFALASVRFAAFLFFFREMAGRKVLKGFGYRLQDAPAARLWSTSELARYLPGAVAKELLRSRERRGHGLARDRECDEEGQHDSHGGRRDGVRALRNGGARSVHGLLLLGRRIGRTEAGWIPRLTRR